ncbi:MAG: hydroxyacylglutathione hydrolase [Pseudomonadales bacterium]|nr:hydroxyacylglutathione hydrolase [Pseudomonadales bacterium]MBO6565193.1 hydroxyacylglutathione hydrolase [Pseudomonadales bacterium]MBO6595812.1 hydroxyacylglutathione hydrolase [Pseudomonadales bacterium]MBO6657432.1 hydroxyacylglutathione hydrolase [Pseudomonadales bacterium]MBO6702417.1 hydroxyacylglutathione hydrolase [Pseudomonadales bacterium]
MPLEVHQFPCLSDNYGYLIHDPEAGVTATIDTPEVDPINAALKEKGWQLTHILNTHHHFDHAGGNLELKQQWDCTIVGSRDDADRIPGIDIKVGDGDTYTFGNFKAEVFDVSGHTIGHIAFYFPDAEKLFCGDALFALGCGRLFEGSPAQMWDSLQKLIELPDCTGVYCAHEYTQANAAFALSVEPQNAALQLRSKDIDSLRSEGKPTVPSTIGLEKETNPFLRPMSADLQATLNMQGAELVDVFAETRRRKDRF